LKLSESVIGIRLHPFNGWLSGTTWVSRYQKGKTSLDLLEQESEWQWHELGHLQICTLPQTANHASTPPLSLFTGQMLFLPANQPNSVKALRASVY